MAINTNDGYAGAPPEALMTPARRVVAVAASSTAFDACRGFIAKSDETITVDGLDGGTGVDIPVLSGQVYPIRIVKVTTSTGGLVLLY